MSGALAVIDDLPDLLGTAPSDLVPDVADFADAATAKMRAERIRAHLVTFTQMRQDIADAFAFRDWAALGYSSWYAYLTGEFGPELHQLARNRADRADTARALRLQGLSTRQIGGVLGVDAKTVRNDTAGAETPAAVTGADGKTYPASRGTQAEAGTPEVAASGDESPAGSAVVTDRPGSHLTDSPAGRDPQEPVVEPGEAVSAAVATPGQPGPEDRGRVRPGLRARPSETPRRSGGRGPRVRPASRTGRATRADHREPRQPRARGHNLRELLRDAATADIPLFALRQQREDLDRLIQRLEATTQGAS
jgi:hypothetical protein